MKYWIILYQNKIFRNELHNTKSQAKEFLMEYAPKGAKIIRITIKL
jgi:hypothetical protein